MTDAFSGGGELGGLIRSMDWSKTPLGPMDRWPQSLKTSLSLILSSQHPMWIGWGPEATFVYNDAYIPVLSRAKHPWALGRPAAEVWAEIWDVCGPLADKVFRQAEPTFVEDVRLFMNRGDYIEETYYSFSYSPIRDESGGVGGLFCPSAETTSRILNARRLKTLSALTAGALLHSTIESAGIAAVDTLAENTDDVPFALLYLTSEDGTRLDLGRAYGVVGEVLLPESVSLESGDSVWPIGEVARTGTLAIVETAHLDGLPMGLAEQRVREAVVLPVVSSQTQERPVGVLVMGVNAARKRDAEYETFYELVAAQFGRAIQNARTVEAEKRRADMLAALDRAKTDFFSNVSHEFRTPLTLMLGPLEDALVSAGVLEGESLETVQRNALRLLKLVNTLLDFSRMEAGRIRASFEPVDLAVLTRDLASAFESAMQRGGLRFEVDCPALPGPIHVDHDMWEKIVLNLLSNALKFTFEGTVRVGLRAVGELVELTVSDTGAGIPEEELPRLFERFHRIEGTRSRTHEGSGIGLALVHDLVGLHGGNIRATSRVGEGTTFTVSIPIGFAHLPPERVGTKQASAKVSATVASAYVKEALRWLPDEQGAGPEPDDAPAGAARVLLADDNADMRAYVARLLRSRFHVEVAADGMEALAAVRRRRPDLVITDVMMPNLDGFGLLRELRSDPLLRAIPIIMLSARAGEEARVEGVEAGADDYLVKPFSARELVARADSLLQLAELHRQREAALVAAEQANRAKDDFIAMLGHELRNPLAPILTATQLLRLRGTDASLREVNVIERQAHHLVRLVDDLLDVSRITSGKVTLARESVEVADVVALAIETASPVIESARHTLSTDVAKEGLVVDVDRVRMAQVIANLLTNAAKYTPPGGRIRVSAALVGDEISISVEDNGTGISPELLPRIFDVFVQARQTIARSQGGLGLGLTIVRSLVRMHGGTVTAESGGVGKGSRFTVHLPVLRLRARAVAPRSAPTRVTSVRESVLVVDDNTDAAEMLSEALQALGYRTAVAHDGPEALRVADAMKPEVALLDIGLPVMDGYELAQRMHAQQPDIDLFAITGYGQDSDHKRSQEAGFREHLTKPVDLEKLAKLLEAHRAARATRD